MAKSDSRKAPGAARRVLVKRAKGKTAEVPGSVVANAGRNAATAVESDPSDEEVRVRAYFRYLERGASHGASLDDWTEAKKDLTSSRKS